MFNDVLPGSEGDYEALKDLFEQLNESDCPISNDPLFLERLRPSTELQYINCGSCRRQPSHCPVPASDKRSSGWSPRRSGRPVPAGLPD